MKISTANKQGQVVIPIEMRRRFNIDEKTYLKISASEKGILIEPLGVDDAINKNVVNFSKREKPGDFSFHARDKGIRNIADNVDNILYKK